MVASSLVGSVLVLTVAGLLLFYWVTNGIISNSREAAISDSNDAMFDIEQQMIAVGYDNMNSDTLYGIVNSAIQRGFDSGRYQMQFITRIGTFSTNSLVVSSIPESIRQAVDDDQFSVHSVPTQVEFKDGSSSPGLVVASTVSGGGPERIAVYFVFSFEQEARTLAVVWVGAGLSGTIVLLGITGVAYGVSRQTLAPVRKAREAAEKLAHGELTELMVVRGTDDLAKLAATMNYMADQLQQRIQQLEQLSQVQQRFVADVSHELRTPLATVRMAADVLFNYRYSLPEMERKSVKLLNKELNRFETLLADLLEISRFDAGAAVLNLDYCDVVELIQREMESMSELAATSGCELRLHGDNACIARADPVRISRLIRNLLSNAIEHGSGAPIDILVAHDKDVVAFSVRDHGVGFTVAQSEQIFHRFWRADQARTHDIGGTGLGLAISQEDVRLHKGWINAWGRPNQGAHFRITLPRRETVVVSCSPIELVPDDAEEDEEPA